MLNMSLKEEFKAAYDAAKPRIDAALKKADKALAEAKKISEETGIPFHSWITNHVDDNFIPRSIEQKFPGVLNEEESDEEEEESTILSEICDIYDYDGYGLSAGGWQKSFC